ncbi:MAG: thioredoxin 2 [Candidatus Azotimanducaceae bacterium]
MPIAIVCPQCFVTNRVPDARLTDAPTCGKCRQALFQASPVSVNMTQFQKMVAYNDIPVIVDFWAQWCGPCKMFAPVYSEAAQTLEPKFRLLKVDTEAQQDIASQYRIQSIPTIAMFKHGKEFTRQAGAMPLGQFMSWVDQNVQPTAL